MTYRPRRAENKVRDYSQWFKSVLLLGARQCGKTTLLRRLFPDIPIITFDPVQDLHGARQSPDLFLDSFPPPVILDEVQYAPELFSALKRRLDRSEGCGLYFLTGSQNPAMLRQVAESMAGRVGVLTLDFMDAGELNGDGATLPWLNAWLEDKGNAKAENFIVPSSQPSGGLLRTIWRGGFPGLLDLPDAAIQPHFTSYLNTYIERDIRMAGDIRDLSNFGRFFARCAALTAQEINLTQFGREVGIAPATAQKWFTLLKTTFQWHELPAYSGNAVKRLSGKSKGHLSDTGMACMLQKLGSTAALSVSPLRGALFETWAVNELRKQSASMPSQPAFYHWRTKNGAEVDVVLEQDGCVYLLEMKCKTELKGHDLSGIRSFRETYGQMFPAVIIYAGEVCRKLDEHTLAMPWNAMPVLPTTNL